MSLGLASLEKALELSCDRYREPYQGAGVVPTRQEACTAQPASEACLWAWRRSKKPLELSFHRYRQRVRRWGSAHPPEACLWAWRRSKKPLELSCDRYREPDQGAGVVPTHQEACLWAWRRSKKPLELSCDRYREPDQGAGAVPTRQEACLWAWPSPNGPTSRVAVESGTYPGTGAVPACLGASDTLDVWPKPRFRLSRFPNEIHPGSTPLAAVPRGRPGRGRRKRPEATVPALVTPKPYPDGTSKRLPLTDRPPARRRDRSRSREKARSPGQGHPKRGWKFDPSRTKRRGPATPNSARK
ncbi:hypothetical protein G5714_024660 [Onychostoma macrolepis]|uniref:Uncharacterized protein n=1 Tax=Onychostoma macrolepis TaxID=369639 RepID=A0A7J6BH72_9TELE|nr:hypothetical protein G5714_024660 [Onychostoma macrolepis]